MPLFVLLLFFFGILAALDFIYYFIKHKRYFKSFAYVNEFVLVLLYPWLYLLIQDIGTENDCCATSAVFSPEHRLSAYFFIILCTLTFFYVAFRERLAPPLIEVLVNALLLAGIIFNIVLGYHIDLFFFLIGNLPIILLFLIRLAENQRKVKDLILKEEYKANGMLNHWAALLLGSQALIKYPILVLLCLPILFLAASILLLFGQQPDSIIRSFTDTYKHGLSQLDYECENVMCGGHYLCSVAANGHVKAVKPERLGVRNGGTIVCNRQLLISNAFEELIEMKLPKVHHLIRKNYNQVGRFIHKYYGIFEHKFFADLIYFLMKPLEFLFWVILYATERNPENRIAQQYLSVEDRNQIRFELKRDTKK